MKRADLYCTNERSGGDVPYQRIKQEYFHRSPDVVLFHDFVIDGETNRLKARALPNLKDALLYDSANAVKDLVDFTLRLGKAAWIADSTDATTRRITRRVGEYTGLNVTHPMGENLQMSNYGLGSFFHDHLDYDNAFADNVRWTPEMSDVRKPSRLATFMIYLTDVKLRGATVFTRLRITVRPIRNTAVFWYNYDAAAISNVESQHAGCPVLLGQKWVANKWIRAGGNEFHHQCPLPTSPE